MLLAGLANKININQKNKNDDYQKLENARTEYVVIIFCNTSTNIRGKHLHDNICENLIP